jgi:hypothetical protein
MNYKLKRLLHKWIYGIPLAILLVAPLALASHIHSVNTDLSGDLEVPAVQTDMTGTADFEYDADDDMLTVELDIEDGQDITGAHLHCGSEGEEGPVVVSLYNNANGFDGDLHQVISGGDNLIADNNCSPAINTLEDLSEAVADGEVYVNVHTTSYPDGAIRGQLDSNQDEDEDEDGDDDEDDDDDQDDDSPMFTYVRTLIQRIFDRVGLDSNF